MMTKLALFAHLAYCFLPSIQYCHAFQPPVGRIAVTRTELNAAHQEGCGISISDGTTINSNNISRRSVFSIIIGAATLPIVTAFPRPSSAIVGGATQSARVESWPGIESLEPLYEFKLSIDAIVVGVQETKNWPFIQKRLEKFFGGFIVNEKNFYMGVGLEYMNEIKYDAGELPNYIVLDKETRFGALENTMKNLDSLKIALADMGVVDANTVNDLARASQSSLQSFFGMIPDQDVKALEELFESVRKADTNRDGILTSDELIFLSPLQQEVWKRRMDKFG